MESVNPDTSTAASTSDGLPKPNFSSIPNLGLTISQEKPKKPSKFNDWASGGAGQKNKERFQYSGLQWEVIKGDKRS